MKSIRLTSKIPTTDPRKKESRFWACLNFIEKNTLKQMKEIEVRKNPCLDADIESIEKDLWKNLYQRSKNNEKFIRKHDLLHHF